VEDVCVVEVVGLVDGFVVDWGCFRGEGFDGDGVHVG